MKFPKLKQHLWCMFFVYAPAILLPLGGFIFLIIAEEFSPTLSGVFGVSGFAFIILSLVYLFKNFAVLIRSDILFQLIEAWKGDRTVFIYDKNGLTQESVLNRITQRCRKYGKVIEQTGYLGEDAPCGVIYKHRSSLLMDSSSLKMYTAVYSVENLDTDRFERILESTKAILTELVSAEERQSYKKSEPVKAAVSCAVIIIAQSAADDVGEKARKQISFDQGYILPCVVESTTGRYYFDSQRDPIIGGANNMPPKNYAVNMIRKIVFAGKLPKDHPENRPKQALLGYDDAETAVELSLWKHLADTAKEDKETDKKVKEEITDAFQTMADGEVFLGEYAIYCKLGGSLTALAYIHDSEDPESKKIFAMPPYEWNLPKKKKIASRDRDDVCSTVQKQLMQKGYDCSFD